MTKRHRIQFPPADVRELCQDEVYFFLLDGESRERIRLHDYGRIFEVDGLYEQVVYERLKCLDSISGPPRGVFVALQRMPTPRRSQAVLTWELD